MLLEVSSSGHVIHGRCTPSPHSDRKHPPQPMQRLMPRTTCQSCNHKKPQVKNYNRFTFVSPKHCRTDTMHPICVVWKDAAHYQHTLPRRSSKKKQSTPKTYTNSLITETPAKLPPEVLTNAIPTVVHKHHNHIITSPTQPQSQRTDNDAHSQ